jgi:hypothetical protein
MAKESKRKVKYKFTSPKYVSSDDDEDEQSLLSDMSKNPTVRIKGHKLGFRMSFLSNNKSCLFKRKSSRSSYNLKRKDVRSST